MGTLDEISTVRLARTDVLNIWIWIVASTGFHLVAFADEDRSKQISVTVDIRPKNHSVTLQGPVLRENITSLTPQASSRCKEPLRVLDVSLQNPGCGYYCVPYVVKSQVKSCHRSGYRVRLMQVSHNTWYPAEGDPVNVLATKILQGSKPLAKIWAPKKRCGHITAYIEVCVKTAMGILECTTSRYFNLPPDPDAGPYPKWRPPYLLSLNPEDQIKWMFSISNNISGGFDGFTNGRYRSLPPQYRIRTEIVVPYGRRVYRTAWTNSRKTRAEIPPNLLNDEKVLSLDGATVALNFARKDCDYPATFEGARYATRLAISKTFSPLIKQDSRLPNFTTPSYPPTVYGHPVRLHVEATNNGGGKTKNGRKTKLSYQWYVRTHDYETGSTYADMIIGATSQSITLANATCNKDVECWGKFGLLGLHKYYVDVCNTFGCRRSAAILPSILSPKLKPGQEWYPENCDLVGENISCYGGQRYCVVKGLVQMC